MNRIFKYNVLVILTSFVRPIGSLASFIILQSRKHFSTSRSCKSLTQSKSFLSEDLGSTGSGLSPSSCRKFEGEGEGAGDRFDVNISLTSLSCSWLDEEQSEDEKFLLESVIGSLEFSREPCISSSPSFVARFDVVPDSPVHLLSPL